MRRLKNLRSIGLSQDIRAIMEEGPPDTLPAQFHKLFSEKEAQTASIASAAPVCPEAASSGQAELATGSAQGPAKAPAAAQRRGVKRKPQESVGGELMRFMVRKMSEPAPEPAERASERAAEAKHK